MPKLIDRYSLDFVAINGENAAGGFGITEAICNELLDAGADCVTLGNHAFDQKEALVFIERQPRLIRPINFPEGHAGQRRRAVQGAERRRRAGHQRHGPRVHDRARLPVPRHRHRAHRLQAEAGRRRHPHRLPCRGDEREAGAWRISSTGAPAWSSAPTRMRRRPTSGCCRAARPTCRDVGMCGDYNSVLGMDTRRADQPLPDQDPARTASSRRWARRRSPASPSRSTTRRGLPCAQKVCGSVVWNRPSRCFGSREIERDSGSPMRRANSALIAVAGLEWAFRGAGPLGSWRGDQRVRIALRTGSLGRKG